MAVTGWGTNPGSRAKEASNDESSSLRVRAQSTRRRRNAANWAGAAARQRGARPRSERGAGARHDGDRAGVTSQSRLQVDGKTARWVDGKRSVTMKTLACGDLVPGCP